MLAEGIGLPRRGGATQGRRGMGWRTHAAAEGCMLRYGEGKSAIVQRTAEDRGCGARRREGGSPGLRGLAPRWCTTGQRRGHAEAWQGSVPSSAQGGGEAVWWVAEHGGERHHTNTYILQHTNT